MNSAKTYRLPQIMEIIGGGTPKTNTPRYWNGSIPWISVADMSISKRFIERTEKYITEAGLKESSTKILAEGDLIISARGTVGVVNQIQTPMAFNQTCYGLRPNRGLVDDGFFYYLMLSTAQNLKKIGQGGVFNTITKDLFDSINVSLPPIEHQRKIASILWAWDRAIDNIDKLISAKQKLKQALMQKLLTGQVRISGIGKLALKTKGTTEGWAVHKLGEICSIVVGKTPSRHNSKFWDATKSTDNMWITISDMQTDKISDSKEYVSNIAIKQCRMKLVEAGTMIVSFKLSIGKIGFLGRNGYTNEAIAALTPKIDAVDMSYLSVILPEVFSGLDSSIAIKGKTLNQEKMKAASIVLPSIIEQIKVSKILTTYSKEIEILMRIKYRYQTEKLWLSQKLFDVF